MSPDVRSPRAPLTPEERASLEEVFRRLGGTYYEILGVPKDSDRAALRTAYLELSKRFHPDLFVDRDMGRLRPFLDAIFREMTAAFEVLSSPEQRAEYDRAMPVEPGRPRKATPSRGEVTDVADTSRAMRAQTPPQGSPDVSRAMRARTPVPVYPRNADHATIASNNPGSSPPGRPSNHQTTSTFRAPTLGAPRRSVETGAIPSTVTSASTSMPPPRGPTAATSTFRAPTPAPTRDGPVQVGGASAPRTGPRASLIPPEPTPEAPTRDRAVRLEDLDAEVEQATRAGNLAEVANLYRAAVSLRPDDPSLRARLARAEEAAAGSNLERLVAYARTAERHGRWEAAAEAWLKCVAARPDAPQLLLNAALAMMEANRDTSQVADLARRAIQLAPDLLPAHLCLARAFFKAGRTGAARTALDAAIKLDPQHPDVLSLAQKLKG